MPSCAPESMNDVRRVTPSARRAGASPASARAVSRARFTAVYANSCATKYAVKAVIKRTTAMPRPMSTKAPNMAGRVFGVRSRRSSLPTVVVTVVSSTIPKAVRCLASDAAPSVALQPTNAEGGRDAGGGTQRGLEAAADVVDIEVGTDRDQTIGRRRGRCLRDVHRCADHVDDVDADPAAVAHGDGALDAIHAGRRLLEEVDERTGIDAPLTGGGDCGRVHVMVRFVDEQFPKRQLPRFVRALGDVEEQRRIDAAPVCSD